MTKDMQLAKRLNRGNTNSGGLFIPEGAERNPPILSDMASASARTSTPTIAPAPVVASASAVASAPDESSAPVASS